MNKLLPPRLALVLSAVTVPLGLIVPLAGPGPTWVRLLGVPITGLGLWLAKTASSQFERVGTNIQTFDDPDVLVTTGLFARSRNPMYLGLLVALGGVAVLVGGVTVWLAPLVFFVASARWYIPFEERRMTATFGRDYDAYRHRVRRWLTLNWTLDRTPTSGAGASR